MKISYHVLKPNLWIHSWSPLLISLLHYPSCSYSQSGYSYRYSILRPILILLFQIQILHSTSYPTLLLRIQIFYSPYILLLLFQIQILHSAPYPTPPTPDTDTNFLSYFTPPTQDTNSPFSVLYYSFCSGYRFSILRPILLLLFQIEIHHSPYYTTPSTSFNSHQATFLLPFLPKIRISPFSVLSLSLVLPTQIILSYFYLNKDNISTQYHTPIPTQIQIYFLISPP